MYLHTSEILLNFLLKPKHVCSKQNLCKMDPLVAVLNWTTTFKGNSIHFHLVLIDGQAKGHDMTGHGHDYDYDYDKRKLESIFRFWILEAIIQM